ncbi:hypothetical protein EON63_02520 [archaeon]|nr:MAG: hypothetical protein EON63_02520 [archaeon]
MDFVSICVSMWTFTHPILTLCVCFSLILAVQHRASPAPLSPRQLVRTTTLQDTQPARRLERLLPQPPYPCSEMEL